MKCVICKKNEASQEHHVSYVPELKIDVCIPCHEKVHPKHGVGKGADNVKIIKDTPFYTYIVQENGKFTVKEADTHEILINRTCKCGNVNFEIYSKPDNTRMFLRCRKCGQDALITKIEMDKTNSYSQVDERKLDYFLQTTKRGEEIRY